VSAIVSLIWAMGENRVIGRGGALPWHLPDEMRHFVRTTRGKPVVMGRRQWDALGRPLPGRVNIVVTHRPFEHAGVHVAGDLADALRVAAGTGADEIVVIGGAELYAQALPFARRLYMTVVHAEPDGDVRFPPYALAAFTEVSREHHPADARHAHAFTIFRYERQSAERVPPA
jgi:dihydrofolate reductase